MRLGIVVVHAAFDTSRHAMAHRLERELLAQDRRLRLYVHRSTDESSHLPNYIEAVKHGVRMHEITHLCVLPDDAILAPHFVQVLTELVAQHPEAILDLVSNHREAAEVAKTANLYSSIGGTINFGGTMSVERWRAYLAWREESIDEGAYVPFDDGINLWSAGRGETITKPLPSLCQHDLSRPSLDGNEWQNSDPDARILRTSQVWEPEADLRGRTWGPAVPVARTFARQHWDAVAKLRPIAWDVEAMYTAHRGGPVSATPHVMIAVPLYGEPAAILAKTDPSRERVIEDLTAHGIEVSLLRTPGDSLVQRMRQRVCHAFMKSSATHLLWWDADVECLTPSCVREMIATGHPLVAGAYPFKDTTKRVVCNLWPDDVAGGQLTVVRGCLEVQDAGTGFMLVERKVHASLMAAHPELLHWSLGTDDHGEPLWALYDTSIRDGVYLSEDYQLCRLWQDWGGQVHVYVPARFRHWGLHGFESSLPEQWGMELAK